jgi:hypothetical protein
VTVKELRDGILFIEDVAEAIDTSVTTIKRKLAAGTFPIPTIPSADRRHRWSVVDVQRYRNGELQPQPVRKFRRLG